MHHPPGHDFFSNYTIFPYYQRNLQRLSVFLFEMDPNLKIIDVGANIGDTALLIRSVISAPLLCVEGDEKFIPFLEKNTRPFREVHIEKTFLGAPDQGQAAASRTYEYGTMRFQAGGDSLPDNMTTLDSLLLKNEYFTKAGLLKIDTDGFDFHILRGASDWLSKARPVLFFEYDREYLRQQGVEALQVFEFLDSVGYHKVMFYDNLGKLMMATDSRDAVTLRQLTEYSGPDNKGVPYYDLCVFPEEKDSWFQAFLEQEWDFFMNNPRHFTKSHS